MSLTVEDGKNIADANSYVTVEYARAYATARNLPLPESDADLMALLVRGFDYVESKADRYKGVKTYPYGGASWPRIGAYVGGDELPETTIPFELKKAQVRFAVEVHSNPAATADEQRIKSEQVGPLKTEYFDDLAGAISDPLASVDDLLAPLLTGMTLRTMRG